MTIRKRLALWYCGLLTLIILIFGIAVITISRIALLNTVDEILNSTSETIVGSISMSETFSKAESEDAGFLFHSEKVFHLPGVSVQIWRTVKNGQSISPILERASADINDVSEALDPGFIHTTDTVYNSTVINEVPERVISQPLYMKDNQQLGIVQVAIPVNTIESANDQLLVITVFSALACILFSVLLGFGLSAHLLKPIAQITNTAAKIVETDDLSTRIEWDGADDELGELARCFNRTMERLEELFKVQQRFIGDISHELRTPLTSIFGHLEIMQRYGYDKESLDAAHREAARMSRMINDLLLLTRADSGEILVDLYPVDLDSIVLEVYGQILLDTKDRNLEISLGRIDHLRIQGNADRIRQLLLNLLNNSISFTNDGGKIILSIYKDAQNAVIAVQDTGIGISESDLTHIFDRFFQADEARVRHSESDGAGLGLSIVRWIADIHGGTIHVTSTQGKGSLFTVRFPIK